MSDQSRFVPEDAPTTRRELREREAALAAEREAERLEQQRAAERRATLERLARERSAARPAAPAQPVAPAPAAAHVPAAPPQPAPVRSPVFEQQPAVVSRRSLRAEPGPATVVRPPVGAAGTRGLDASGQLTPVQPVAGPAPVPAPAAVTPPTPSQAAGDALAEALWQSPTAAGPTPAQVPPPVAPPARTSVRQPVRRSTEGYGTTPAPADPDAGRPVLHRSAGTAPAWAQGDAAPGWAAAQPQAAAPVAPAWGSTAAAAAPVAPAWGAVAGQATTPAPGAETTAAPSWAAVTGAAAPATPAWGSGPETVAAPAWGAGSETVAAPAWGAVDASAPPTTVAGQAMPWEATPAADPVPSWDAAFSEEPESGLSTDHDDALDDLEPEEPRHAYTWLHYLILVSVAFVLGLLLWELVLGPHGGPANAAGASTASQQTTQQHTTRGAP